MDWLNVIVSILSGLAIVIPLVVELVKWVKQAVQEKNWSKLITLVMTFMADAEKMFQTGEERKNYVILAIKASADTINYKIDMEQVSKLIDDLAAMSKVVNAPVEQVEEEITK